MAHRLLIFTTHPIQYQAPWFKLIAADPRFTLQVLFSFIPNRKAQGIGFGRSFEWDTPLLEGYNSEVLGKIQWATDGSHFLSGWTSGLIGAIRRFNPDAAMVLGWQDSSLVQAFATCKLMGIPVILRGESNDKRARASWKSWVHRAYVTRAEAYLAIGDANASFYMGLGVGAEKIRFARYCVDNEKFFRAADLLRPKRTHLRRNWEVESTDFCVAFVGKLEPKKRVADFIEAAGRARRLGAPVRALVVGTGAQLEEAKALAERLTVPVTFTGFLNQGEIASAYVAADALVLPSDFGETWGLVCNEAMACGTPAIVSERVGNAGDLVIDGVSGAVVPFADPAAIARVLASWATDRDLHARMSLQARERVASRFTVSAAVEGLQEAVEVALRG